MLKRNKVFKKKYLILTIILLIQISFSKAQTYDTIRVENTDIIVKAYIRISQVNLDETKFCFQITNRTDTNYILFSSNFSPTINIINSVTFCFFSNEIADHEGRIMIKALKPKESYLLEFTNNDIKNNHQALPIEFIQQKYFYFELNYLVAGSYRVENKLNENNNEIEVGRFYLMDKAIRISISNF